MNASFTSFLVEISEQGNIKEKFAYSLTDTTSKDKEYLESDQKEADTKLLIHPHDATR